MHVGIVGHREAWLHGVEIMPGMGLCRGQSYHRTTVNVMEADLLDARWDVVQAVIEKRAPSVDDRRSHIRR